MADVPCGGRKVTLAFTVRKCVCGTPACPRKIFTERIAEFVQSYARMTNRLSEAIQTLGFANVRKHGFATGHVWYHLENEHTLLCLKHPITIIEALLAEANLSATGGLLWLFLTHKTDSWATSSGRVHPGATIKGTMVLF